MSNHSLSGYLVIAGLLFCGPGGAAVFAAERLVIGFVVHPGSPDATFQRLFITEAFRRVGVGVEIRHYPMKRASMLADAGAIDGEAERVADYHTRFTNLVRVEACTRSFKFAAYTVDPVIVLEGHGWEALRDTPCRVEYQRGVKRARERLTPLVAPTRLSEIDATEQGIRKLALGRTDIFVTFEHWMEQAARAEEFRGITLRRIALLEEVELYPYLHKKHQELAPRLAAALRQMRAEGLLDDYLDRAFR